MSKPFKSLDSLLRLMRKRNITIEKGRESSVYGLLISLRLLLPRIAYKSIIDEIISELLLLKESLPIIQFNQVLAKMELTLQWKQTLEALK